MRTFILAATGALVLAAPAGAQDAPAAPLSLHLVCDGDLTTIQRETTSVTVSKDYEPSNSASGESVTNRIVHSRARVEVEVAAGAVRFHPAVGMIPLISAKTPTGWYDLTEVIIDPDQIAGRFRLNFANKPTIRVDRHSGELVMRGMGGLFNGTCEKSATPVGAQKF